MTDTALAIALLLGPTYALALLWLCGHILTRSASN